jgi:hypothetical protein
VTIPISEIAGVGLVFVRSVQGTLRPPPDSWYMNIWRTNGSVEGMPISYIPAARNARFGSARFDAAAETDPNELAATPAAQVAREIYDRVIAQQGLTGPLVTQQRQKHPTSSIWLVSPITAFWSPDGILGPVEQTTR